MSSNISGSSPDPLINPSTTGTGPITPASPSGTTTTSGATSPGTTTPTAKEAPPAPPTPSSTKTSTETAEIPVDFQVFEGTDVMNRADVVTQQFIAVPRETTREFYQAVAQHPTLVIPDPEGHTGPQPFDSTWQKAVHKDFKERVKENLLKKIKATEAPIAPQDQAKKDVEKGTSEAVTTPQERPSRESREEGARPELVPPEVEVRATTIIQVVMSGKTEKLSKEDREIAVRATEQTQKTWGLPETWSLGSKSITDWTPIAVSEISINLEPARREVLAENIVVLLTSLDKASQNVTESLPADHPDSQSVQDLTRVIAKALRDLKGVLRDIQKQEADLLKKMSDVRLGELESKFKEIGDNINKMIEAAAQRAKQAEISKVMQIVAPVVSALIIAAGMIALPFTAGASSALIIAGLAVSTLMLTYTVLDAQFELTSQFSEWVSTKLDTLFPGAKYVFLAMLALILIAAICVSGGTAAGSVISGITTQAVKQAAFLAAKQLTIQLSMMAIMSSNILPELGIKALIELKVIDENDERSKIIATAIISGVLTIVMSAAVAKAAAAGGATGIIAGIKETVKSVGETLSNIGRTIANILKAIAEGMKTAISELKEMVKSLARMLAQLGTYIVNAIKELPAKAQQAGRQLLELVNRLRDTITAGNFLQQLTEEVRAGGRAIVNSLERLGQQIADAGQAFLRELQQAYLSVEGKLVAATERAVAAMIAAGKEAVEYLENIRKGFVVSFIKPFLEADRSNWKSFIGPIAQVAGETLKIGKLGMEITKGFVMAKISFELQHILEEIGEKEKAIAIRDTIIKFWKTIEESINSGIASDNEWLANVGEALDNVFASARQTVSRATQISA